MLGLGVGGGQLLVSSGTLLLLYAATASIGHSAKVRGEWEQYGLALLAMLLYNMSKAVLRSGAGAALGQALLCAASFWNAWVNRQQTNVRIPNPPAPRDSGLRKSSATCTCAKPNGSRCA